MKDILRIESITQVHDFMGFAKPKHPLVSVIPAGKHWFDRDVTDTRFVMDLYNISLKTFHTGSFQYGRNAYDFQEGTLVFTAPGQVMEFDEKLEQSTSTEGWTVLFHPDLIRKSSLGSTIEEYSFFDYESNEALHLSDDERTALTDLVNKIYMEYSQNIDKHSQELIVANIEMLLKYSKRYYDRQFFTRTNLNKDILSDFNRLVKQYYNSEQPFTNGVLTVKECANMLSMSVNYLGDLIKTETGRNAKDHIQDYVVERAKNMLLGSNEAVSNIAYSLGFEYPQGFNKLFKARVGLSPSDYRNLN